MLLMRYSTNTGLPASRANPDGTAVTWGFDDDYTLDTQTLTNGSATLASWSYDHDGLRRITAQDFAGTPAGTALPVGFTNTYTYTYTPAGRLASWNDGATTTNLTWDRDGNRLTNGTDTYTYRADGSIATLNSTPFVYDAAGRTVADTDNCYRYDGFDRRVAFTSGSTADPCPVDTTSTSDPRTTIYAYDGLGRQTSHTAPDAAADRAPVTLHYDGLSSRIVAENGAGTGTHHGDATYVLDASGAPTALWSHPYENGTRPERVEYLTGDGNGNITTVTTNAGSVDCAVRFDPYGNPINPTGAAAGNGVCASVPTGTAPATVNDLWYQAGRQDATSGQYDFGARTYDPGTASWLTPDTYRSGDPGKNLSVGTDPLTANTYRYVNGDPINANDPTGHRLCARDCIHETAAERRIADEHIRRRGGARSHRSSPDGLDSSSPQDILDVVTSALGDLVPIGACAHASGTVDLDQPGTMLEGSTAELNVGIQSCLLLEGFSLDEVAFGATIDFGGGVQLGELLADTDPGPFGAEFGGGVFLSNAGDLSQLEGESVCLSVSTGAKYGGGAVGCVGINSDNSLSKVVTLYPFLQMRSGPGLEVQTTHAFTSVVTAEEMLDHMARTDPNLLLADALYSRFGPGLVGMLGGLDPFGRRPSAEVAPGPNPPGSTPAGTGY